MTHARLAKKIPPAFSLNVDFSLAPGVTVLYGPGAAGKTMILEALAGLVQLDSGRILLDDVLLFDAEARVHVAPRRRACGYLPREQSLFPHMTLRQNLAFAARGARLERHRRVAEIMERFQLTDAAALRPLAANAGQRLRAALARAILSAPKLLLLDNPDLPEALLRQTRAEFTGMVLLVTPDLDLCCAAADQMLVIDSGRILQRGSPREVLDQPESVAVARLLGIPNLFDCTIAGLDPGRNSSRLQGEHFEVAGPYFPGHFRGDRISVAIRPERVRVHSAGVLTMGNAIAVDLVRVSRRAQSVRLEFAGGIFADLPPEEYERQKDNRGWQVEFPPEALRIL